MADIEVKKGNGGNMPQAQPGSRGKALEPLRRLRELMDWDPFLEMAPLWREEPKALGFVPDFEVKETKDQYLFKADVPGVKEQDIDISLTGTRITITGKREEEKEETSDAYYACERSYGSFSRSFTLPEGADLEHVQAELRSGVLTVVVPKRPEVQAKKVTVKVAEKGVKA